MAQLEGLNALTLPALRARLQQLATDASIAARKERPSEVAEALRTLRGELDHLEGPALLMAEVAEAFVARLVPGIGSPERDAARQVVDDPAGCNLLARLAGGDLVPSGEAARLADHTRVAFGVLVERGTLIDAEGSLSLSANAQGWVADLVEPLPFRLWRIVQSARLAASWERDPDRAAQIVAGMTGTLTPQARAFLDRERMPINDAEASRAPRYKRGNMKKRPPDRRAPAPTVPSVELAAEPAISSRTRGRGAEPLADMRQSADLQAAE